MINSLSIVNLKQFEEQQKDVHQTLHKLSASKTKGGFGIFRAIKLSFFLIKAKYKIEKASVLLDLQIIAIKKLSLKEEEDYDTLLKFYNLLKKDLPINSQLALLEEYKDKNDTIANFLIRPIFELIEKYRTLHQLTGEKLCLLPKGLSPEQLKEAAQLSEGLEDLFEEEEEEDYIDYAKRIAIQQNKDK